jgi:opacity protein-like surface antigen
MNKIFGIVLAVVATIGMVSTASASDFYVTGNVADTHVKGDSAFSNESETGGGIGIGYDINSWLAVEATYDHLADEGGSRVQSGAVWAVVDPTITTVANMPLKATARAGYAYTDISGNDSFSDTQPAYGVGLALGVSDNMDVTVGYVRRTNVGRDDVDLDTASLGVKYSF